MSASRVAEILLGAYLFGGIPFGLMVGFLWKGIDIRKYGSGNIGATNVLRLLGRPAALVVFLLDTGKGFGPVWYAIRWENATPLMAVGAGTAAILGHTFSPYLRFRGGKGVATGLGVFIALAPEVAVIAFFIWVLIASVTRFVSVASMVAGISVPILMVLSNRAQASRMARPIHEEYIVMGIAAAVFIVIKHRANITRLRNHTEPRIGERVDVSNPCA